MGWWPFSSSSDDPLKDLDPELRQFLDAEKLSKASTTSLHTQPRRKPHDPERPGFRGDLGIKPPSGPPPRPFAKVSAGPNGSPETDDEGSRPLPTESLYQDGRYAHLWKTYRNPREAEQAAKSDAEKLSDILHAFTSRRDEMKAASLENCAGAVIAVHNCFKSGKWKTRAMMCREENVELQRCVDLQRKLLRALGFMSMWERSEEEGERIQMHADRLYQRMLRQEKEADEARAKGLPPPPIPQLIRETRPGQPQQEDRPLEPGEVRPMTDVLTFDELSPKSQERLLKNKWKDLNPMELELAKKEWNQQILIAKTMGARMNERAITEYVQTTKRRQEGKATFGDYVKSWFDMRTYPELPGEDNKADSGK